MRVIRVHPAHPDPAALEAAAAVLRAGGLVAFPTETVYGLGANALDEAAVQRVFEAKGRPAFNPLIAHCQDLPAARRLAQEWPEAAQRLGERFWPGPLTLVVAKRPEVPDGVTAGLPTVALRVPGHRVARELLRRADLPVAAPSANRFTELSPTTAAHVLKGLSGRIDLVLDAGPTPIGIESTVVDVSGRVPVLLRPGSIGPDALAEALGASLARPGHSPEDAAARPAPGMLRRHYAPRAPLVLVEDRGELGRRARAAAEAGSEVGALLMGAEPAAGVPWPVHMPTDPDGYATALYAALHELDDRGCDLVLVEAVPRGAEWESVRDRLSRAAEKA